MKRNRRIQWWEPGWSYRPSLVRDLRELFSLRMWMRIVGISGLLASVSALVLRKLIPDLEFEWTCYLIGVTVIPLGIGIFFLVLWLVPPSVTISNQGVARQHGGSTFWMRKESIALLQVRVMNSGRHWLCISLPEATHLIGVPTKVRAEELGRILNEHFPTALKRNA